MENELKVKDIKYGLIAIDPTQEGEMKDVLHFCGYWNPPTDIDIESLRQELETDEEFGLTEIAHRLDIIPCPHWLLEEFIKDAKDE